MYGNKAEFLWFMAWSPRLLSPSWWTNQLLWKASVGNWGSSQQRVPSLGPMSGHLHPCSTPKCWSNFNVVSALGVAHPMSDELRGFAFLRTGRVWGTTMPQWLLPKSQPVQRHVVGVESWCLVLCSTRTWYWNHSQPDCLCLDSSPPMPFQPLKFRAIEALKPALKCTDWHRLTTLMSMLGGQLTARVGYNNLRIGKTSELYMEDLDHTRADSSELNAATAHCGCWLKFHGYCTVGWWYQDGIIVSCLAWYQNYQNWTSSSSQNDFRMTSVKLDQPRISASIWPMIW